MKTLATNRHGIGAVQHFKPMTPGSIYRKTRIPMIRHTRHFILSIAVVVLAGLAMAAPRPATAQYAFTIIAVPGAPSTALVGFTAKTLLGNFNTPAANTHDCLFPLTT